MRIRRESLARTGKFELARARPIMAVERTQPAVEQCEMHRLVGTHTDPFVDKSAREFRAEAADQVEGQVDRDELDMRQRMQQGDAAPFRPALAAPGHPRWAEQ